MELTRLSQKLNNIANIVDNEEVSFFQRDTHIEVVGPPYLIDNLVKKKYAYF